MNILFLGDSFTNRTGVKNAFKPEKMFSTLYTGNYVEILCKRLFVHFPDVDFAFYNRGISGDTTEDILKRFELDTENKKIDLVVLLIGHNDIKKRCKDFASIYMLLVSKICEISERLIGISILPMISHPELKSEIEAANAVIKNIIDSNNQLYLDVYQYFVSVCLGEKKIKLYEESNHLSELGNMYIADCVYELVKKMILEKGKK